MRKDYLGCDLAAFPVTNHPSFARLPTGLCGMPVMTLRAAIPLAWPVEVREKVTAKSFPRRMMRFTRRCEVIKVERIAAL